MKTFIAVLFLSGLFTFGHASVNYVYIDDGRYHIFRTDKYEDDFVRVDKQVANDPPTHIDIIDRAKVYRLASYNNSSITVNGLVNIDYIDCWGNSSLKIYRGFVDDIGIWSNATADISGGIIDSLDLFNYAVVNLSGGAIDSEITTGGKSILNITGGSYLCRIGAGQNSQINISGGTIRSVISVWTHGRIYLEGSNFQINGVPVKYGDSAREYSNFTAFGGESKYTGTITGTLADGSVFLSSYTINDWQEPVHTGDIIIVPEPCSVLLLGIGGLMLRKKH